MLNAIYWRLYIIRLALRWVRQINLGDEVVYQGKRWWLNQGVADPYWNLSRDGEYAKDVHRDQFRKVRTPAHLWRSFRFGYQFYMRSWYSIWLQQGIKPWMAGCNIWAGKPPRVTAPQPTVPDGRNV